MAKNSWLKTFDDEEVGVNGLLYKAGFTSLEDSLEGLGRGYDGNEWITINGAGLDVVNGGLRAQAASNFDVTMPDAAGRYSAIRQNFMTRGAIQVDLYVGDICETSGTKFEIIRGYSTAGDPGAPVYVNTQYVALTGDSYSKVVGDANGDFVLDTPMQVTSGSGVKTAVIDASVVLHKGMANADGFLTYGVDYSGNWQRHFINGKLIAQMPCDSYDGEFSNFTMQRGGTQVTMKNLLMFDRPFQRHVEPSLRLSMIGHSFVTRQNLNLVQFDNGTVGGAVGTSFDYSCDKAFNPQLMDKINAEIDIFSVGFSGQDLAYIKSRIIDGTPTAYATGSGNYQDHVKRFRPHFCVIMGAIFNDDGTASLTTRTNIYDITVDLMANGIIPILALEHNNAAGSLVSEHTDALSECQRLQAVNDIGIADSWDVFGTTTDASYRENGGANEHPNFKAQPVYATLIAAEVNRLLLDPPQYSRLAGGFGQYETISAPV